MTRITDKYQIEESYATFSFQPFHQYRSKSLGYALAILLFGGLSAYVMELENHTFLIISTTLLLSITGCWLKELVIYVPIRYTFNSSENAVYQRHIFSPKRKIMTLDEVVIFQSSEMGNWCYKMGKKKQQFVKNYTISEAFSSDKKREERRIAFERAILSKIRPMIDVQNEISANQHSATINR